MQIPLDYYRILGVPVQADADFIKSAFQDRVQQLPRREYSGYAIASRKNLLQKAYDILSNQPLRKDYDGQFLGTELAKTELESGENLAKIEEISTETTNINSSVISPPNLDIEPELFIGALIILLELGEYEILLNLSQPYLEGKEKLIDFTNKTENLSLVWQDLILTVTLANVELAREQWLQQEYELAGESLTQGLFLLEQENLLNSFREEITVDLHRLRPYQIWQLLSRENKEFKDRRKAINLLKEMLDLRGGIEGKESDYSGMNLDDFLKFIQQIRVYLTSSEQQELFEQEAQRPSSAASYLAAYALIARGFSEKKPQLIVRAKNILISLTVHQDVYLEQSICALLLGQTTEAEFSLSQSREKETLKYIQQISQNSPDLLPGLCLYTEKWLQTEVFPQFRDLNRESVSFAEYFDNQRVQNYLEQLSQPLPENNELENITTLPNEVETISSFTQFNELKEKNEQETPLFDENDLGYSDNIDDFPVKNNESNVGLLVTEKQISQNNNDDENLVNFSSFIEADLDSELSPSEEEKTSSIALKSKAQSAIKSNSSHSSQNTTTLPTLPISNENITPIAKNTSAVSTPFDLNSTKNNDRLIWLLLGLFLFAGLIFLAYKLFTSSKVSSLQIPISEPLIIIPETTVELPKPVIPKDVFDQQIALDVVRKWLEAKSKATGPEYDTNPLKEVLTGALLPRWQGEAATLSNKNAYRRYEHTVAIESADPDPQNPDRGTTVARIKEKSQYYANGALNNSLSYEEELLVKYDLIKQKNNWLIQDVEVIKEEKN